MAASGDGVSDQKQKKTQTQGTEAGRLKKYKQTKKKQRAKQKLKIKQ